MNGLCGCGCGLSAPISQRTSRTYGWAKGEPKRFIRGHNARLHPTGAESPSWKGGRNVDPHGYVRIRQPDHPRAMNGYVHEHVLVVERAVGRLLRSTAPIHHVNDDKADNVPPNLVLCDSDAYHALLHERQRALDACGNADARRCAICHGYDRQEDITVTRGRRVGDRAYHRSCATERARERKAAS